MKIANGRIQVELAETSGAAMRIRDAVSGLVHLEAVADGVDDGRLFRVNAPSDTWSSRYADSHVQPHVRVEREGVSIAIRFPDLIAATGESLGIAAEVRIAPAPAADELLFTLRLDNRGPTTLNEVRFPWIGGWRGLGGKGKDRMVLGARNFFDPHSLPTPVGNNYALNHQRRTFAYPVQLFAPWIDVSGPGGGLACVNYMPTAQNGCFSVENLAGYGPGLRLSFGWAHFVVIRPGESWTSPPMGLALHGGDWHATADRYLAWFEAQGRPAPARPVLRRSIGFQNVFFRGFDGAPIRPLADIPRVAAVGRRYGVDHLCVWDALTLGNYIDRGARDLVDYPADERAVLEAGLRQAEAAGTRTSALTNFRHPNVRLHLHDPALAAQIKRRYDGTANVESYSGSHHHAGLWTRHLGPDSFVYSPFSPAHLERVLRITRQYLDFGYTSMFYDQPFEWHPDYGSTAPNCRPEQTHAAALQVIARVRELLLANYPDAMVIGEECDILATPMVDLWMSWRTSLPDAAPDVVTTRYGIPDTMLAWVIDSEPDRASIAFAMGMYFCLMVHGGEGTLEDEPVLARHVSALAALRHATADRTALGRFVDRRGLTVDGDQSLIVHSFDSPSGPAVVAAAPGQAAGGRLGFDRSMFTAGKGPSVVHRLDGGVEPASPSTLEVKLGSNEVLVWLP